MNNNFIIAIVVLVALFGCACGWLYSLRWRSEVRERLFETDATMRMRGLERRATQPRQARNDKPRGQPVTTPQPPKAKGGPKNKNKGAKTGAGTGTGKKQPPKQKQRPPQQGWSSDNQQNEQGNTETVNQNQNQDSGLQLWGSPDSTEQPEVNQSTTSTPTATTAAADSEWGSVDNSAVDSSAPESSGQASEGENRSQAGEQWGSTGLPASSVSGWSAEGSNASGGQEWNPAERRADDHPERKSEKDW